MTESKNLGAELGRGGDWLYRQGEMVLGPLPAQQIVEKLYTGELDGRTEVSPVDRHAFRRVAEVELFKIHLAKAEAKQRVDAAARAERERERRQRTVRIAIVVAVALIVAGGAAAAARYLAIYNPLKKGDDLALPEISFEAPRIGAARSRAADEELLDYPAGGSAPSRRSPEHGGDRPARVAERPPSSERAPRPSSGGGKPAGEADPEGLQMAQVDQAAINSVIAAKRSTLIPCLQEEAQRHPGVGAKIPLEFSIGNEGRVTRLWVDNPLYKQGPLADCLLRELQKWAFKPGQSATVNMSFNIGKGG